jgi:hypothetical protein
MPMKMTGMHEIRHVIKAGYATPQTSEGKPNPLACLYHEKRTLPNMNAMDA